MQKNTEYAFEIFDDPFRTDGDTDSETSDEEHYAHPSPHQFVLIVDWQTIVRRDNDELIKEHITNIETWPDRLCQSDSPYIRVEEDVEELYQNADLINLLRNTKKKQLGHSSEWTTDQEIETNQYGVLVRVYANPDRPFVNYIRWDGEIRSE